MKKRICAIFACLLCAFCLAGCTDTPAANAVAQFDIRADGERLKPLTAGVYCAGADGEVTVTENETETVTPGELTVCGIGCGNTLHEALTALGIRAGYARFDYEYDPYGDGCTALGDCVYDGTIPSSEELSALDMVLTVYYTGENGTYEPVDLTAHDLTEYPELLLLRFCAEGVHELYGQEPGNIFSVECGIETA